MQGGRCGAICKRWSGFWWREFKARVRPPAPPPKERGTSQLEAVRQLCKNLRRSILATLHLMVGLPFSGKTTLARKLERECSALRLTPDEWHVRLFGQDAEDPDHDARHSLIEALLWNIARRALELGTNVILDFGFWAREEREDFRLRAKHLGSQ